MWSYLQPVEDRQDMDSGCNRLEMVARDIYTASAVGDLCIESLSEMIGDHSGRCSLCVVVSVENIVAL
jgi:hypothetical protein